MLGVTSASLVSAYAYVHTLLLLHWFEQHSESNPPGNWHDPPERIPQRLSAQQIWPGASLQVKQHVSLPFWSWQQLLPMPGPQQQTPEQQGWPGPQQVSPQQGWLQQTPLQQNWSGLQQDSPQQVWFLGQQVSPQQVLDAGSQHWPPQQRPSQH
jgi:hypothetical protein